MTKEYSVVIAIYKDGYLARDCCQALADVFSRLLGASALAEALEVIFVNDGSPDDSLDALVRLRNEFGFVKVVDLSRNFGQHEALACGFRLAQGRSILRLNVDMQDHPSEIPRLLEAMSSGGYDLVVGQYGARHSPWVERLTSFLYFELFRVLTGMTVPQRSASLRVMSRKFIDAYNHLTEKSRFPQGLDQWLGFRQKTVEIEHRARADGKSSYKFSSRAQLALSGILYFTDRPLKLIGYFGFGIAGLGLCLGLGVLVQKLTGRAILPGYASLASMILVGFGIQFGFMGVFGLYVGRIFREVQNRPLYIIREIFE